MGCLPDLAATVGTVASHAPVALSLVGLALGLLLQPLAAGRSEAQSAPAFTLSSPAFAHQGSIPTRYTCEGADVSPPLAWSGVPAGARSLVLIVNDPDAPDPAAPKLVWDHWLIYNLPPTLEQLPEAVTRDALPPGARFGTNSWKRADYGGPCPPIGRHRYFHKLYALDIVLPDLQQPDRRALDATMSGHILGTAELIGTYQKQR